MCRKINFILVKFITYGCQMNVNDVELVRSLLLSTGYVETDDVKNVSLRSICLFCVYLSKNHIFDVCYFI